MSSMPNLRLEITSHRFSKGLNNGRPVVRTFEQLMSESGNLVRTSANPSGTVPALYDFHQRHILRIAGLYEKTGDSLLASEQLSNLRKALAVSSFRLAANDIRGDFALGIGGSIIKGTNTFATDADLVVIPRSKDDREAAMRVQDLMSRIMQSLRIDADKAIPFYFDGLPLGEIGAKYPLIPKAEMTDPFLRSMRLSNGVFFCYLMDMQIADVKGKGKTEYEENLFRLKAETVNSKPEIVAETCRDISKLAPVPLPERKDAEFIDIKKEILLPFYLALYAGRAKFNIIGSSPRDTLFALSDKHVITREDAERAIAAVSFLIGIRHLVWMFITEAQDSTKINGETITKLAASIGIKKEDLSSNLALSEKILLEVSENIFTNICA